MSIVQLKSSNPKFSFIIQKNPESQLRLQSIRLGVACGWYSQNNQAYNILFRDAEDEISFKKHKDEVFEYLNTTRYNSALFVINAIDEFLRTAFKNQSTDDSKGFDNVFYINLIHAKNSRYLDAFAKYFQDYKLEYEETAKNNYKIRISTQNSVYELLNFVALFANFIAIVNGEDLFIKEENVVKNLTCLNVIDAPYFVRYLFKMRFLKSDKIYEEYKESLEKTTRGDYKLTFGDNWESRQRFVENKLTFKRAILDIGCGEGKYITRFSKFIEKNNINYYAVDVDKDVLEDAQRRVKNKGTKNVSFFNSLEEFKQSGITEEVDVILSEVIEHMEVDEAKKLIIDILDNVNCRNLIITTPDAGFNVNYFMTEKFRHDDHKFEFNKSEFYNFLNECSRKSKDECAVVQYKVGDSVDGVATTQGAVIVRDWEKTGAEAFKNLIEKV